MPVYILLGRFTRKGMMEIKKHPERLEQAKKAVEAVGGPGNHHATSVRELVLALA